MKRSIVFILSLCLVSLTFALYYIYNGGKSSNQDLVGGDVLVTYDDGSVSKWTTSNPTMVIIDSVTPNVPEIVFPLAGAKLFVKPVKLQWKEIQDETEVKYIVEISTDINFATLISSVTTSTTWFTWTPQQSNKYHWRVGCCDIAGNFSGYTTGWFISQLGIEIIANKYQNIVPLPWLKITILENTVPVNLQLYFTTSPVSTPISIVSDELIQAMSVLSQKKVLIKESLIELVLKRIDTGEDYTSNFNKEVELYFSYNDVNNDNFVDGYNKVFVKSLKVYTLEGTQWVECPSEVDTIVKQVKAKVKHFSVFILAGQSMPLSLNNVVVYPNPFRPEYGINYVTFKGLTSDAKIRVYNIAGELITEFDNKDNDDEEKWVIPQKLASGVYIYLITDKEGNKKIGRMAIIK
ncbi:MAG: T9SS type A sorting domain-containing protein [Endomicrobia bacterium]|nr:T9SS type A sorting domain-containing protein [Endomicrobiia bacterium]